MARRSARYKAPPIAKVKPTVTGHIAKTTLGLPDGNVHRVPVIDGAPREKSLCGNWVGYIVIEDVAAAAAEGRTCPVCWRGTEHGRT